MQYRPDIDGLRAVAVLPVIFFHAGFQAFGGGYVGVDVFFVISGYLITSLIVAEMDAGRFSIVSFYERRARRILPALIAVIVVSGVLSSILLLPDEFYAFAKSAIGAALFSSNIVFWSEAGYFDAAAHTKPLLHTWSLGVEEQYYIFYPVFLLILGRFRRAHWAAIIFPIAVASFAISVWGVAKSPPGAFYLAPARAWELLLGGLLALGAVPALRGRIVRELAAAAGLALIAWGVFAYTAGTPFPGANALAPCLGAALLIHAGASDPPAVNRLLALRPIVFAGLISYSLYLWHWPAFVFARYYLFRSLTPLEAAAVIGGSILAAIVSWRFIERPFRGARSRIGRRAVVTCAVTATAALVAFGTAGVATGGWAQRFPDVAKVDRSGFAPFRFGTCLMETNQTFQDWQGDACFLDTAGPVNALLWGDSHSAQYVSGLTAHRHAIGYRILQFSMGSCPPVFGFDPGQWSPNCLAFNPHVLDVIKRYDIKTVIMAANWKVSMAEHLDLADLTKTIEVLQRNGLKVIVIGQVPFFEFPAKNLVHRVRDGDFAPIAMDPDINKRIAAHVNGAAFVDPLPVFCVGAKCRFRDGDTLLFLDYAHLSAVGSERVVASFLPILK